MIQNGIRIYFFKQLGEIMLSLGVVRMEFKLWWVFINLLLKLLVYKSEPNLNHRHDSIQGTDYIANYFFLNLWVSREKFENLKWWISGDIIPLTFKNFVTLLVQKLKILRKKLTCSQYLDCQFLLSLNTLSFWTYDITNFPKG